MTTAPQRDRLDVTPSEPRRPAGPVDRPRPELLDKRAWGRAVMLLNVVLIAAVAIVGLEHVQREDSSARAVESSPIVASTLPDPDAEPVTVPETDTATDQATDPATDLATDPPATPPSQTAPAPKVQPTMRVNFAKGHGWPVGAGFREAGSLEWPLGVVDRLLTHGPAEGPNAVSWLEKWTKTDVRTIGARVLFAPNHSGAAVLTAWHTSILETSGQQQPRTGMRLVVTPGHWRLVALDGGGMTELASGTYVQTGRSATFNLVRREQTVWVTDPTGTVTPVTDPRVGSLSGPWASWELREDKVGKRPAGFQEIWAG